MTDAALIRTYEVAEILHHSLHKSRRFVFCRSDMDLATTIVMHLGTRDLDTES